MSGLEKLKENAAEIEKRLDQLRRYRDGSLVEKAFGREEKGEEPASPGQPDTSPADVSPV